MELGRRLQGIEAAERPALNSPESVFSYIGGRLLGKTREELYVLSLDTRGRLLGAPAVVGGGVRTVSLRPAELFREPILLEATSVIFAHNHPSGDPAPSQQDINVTRDLVEAGELLGIAVHDHLVIGQNRFVSMRRDGLFGA